VGKVLRVRLTGPEAELGRIPAADVGHLLLGVERTVASAAASVLGRQLRTGRRPGTIEAATRFRLLGLRHGSLVAELDLPEVVEDEEGTLALGDTRLGEMSLEKTFASASGDDDDPGVAEAFSQLLRDLSVGTRYEAVELADPPHVPSPRAVRLDAAARARLDSVAQRPKTARDDKVAGTLVEADFERNTARLRTPTNQAVVVSFSAELADDIQQALRQPTALEGRVTYDPGTSVAVSVELRAVLRGQQLQLGEHASLFWRHRTVEELREEQGVEPVADFAPLHDDEASLEQVEAFLTALEE